MSLLDKTTQSKHLFTSKTFWLGVLMAAGGYVPAIATFAAANPELLSSVAGLLVVGMRAVTSKPVRVKPGA